MTPREFIAEIERLNSVNDTAGMIAFSKAHFGEIKEQVTIRELGELGGLMEGARMLEAMKAAVAEKKAAGSRASKKAAA